jgi:hypothetical protein
MHTDIISLLGRRHDDSDKCTFLFHKRSLSAASPLSAMIFPLLPASSSVPQARFGSTGPGSY